MLLQLLPHLLLGLAVLDEHYALWLIFLVIIPMIDTVFFVGVPSADLLLSDAWTQGCAWSWPICLFYAACRSTPSWQSMLSFGMMHNTALCLADELDHTARGRVMSNAICDFLGLFHIYSPFSVLRTLSVYALMWHQGKLLWHVGAIGVGFLLNEYVSWVDTTTHDHLELDHYGLSHYAMFRFFRNKLLPASYMWVFLCETGLKDWETEEKDQDGLRFDDVPEGPPGCVARSEAADAPPAFS